MRARFLVLATVDQDGAPFAWRLALDEPSAPDRQVHLSVHWPYQGGPMPDAEAFDLMGAAEDALAELIDQTELPVVAFGAGVASWEFQVHDPHWFLAGLNHLLRELPRLPLDIRWTQEPRAAWLAPLQRMIGVDPAQADGLAGADRRHAHLETSYAAARGHEIMLVARLAGRDP